ncbi:thiamine biosynthesis protein ThiS [Endozoicomonas sp. (ex Bugula neritina AB1)]|nr:thiamine biosynthesis protein ThiS [Endozoicomonas sp. (ex Bugula neritina AB1)]
MQIKVNNQSISLEQPLSIRKLLETLSHTDKGVALAVNSQIISRSQWDHHTVQHGDQVTLIKATAGG